MSDIGIITGAAGGIGQATAERFARDGWDLVLVDVADSVKQIAAEVAEEVGSKGYRRLNRHHQGGWPAAD